MQRFRLVTFRGHCSYSGNQIERLGFWGRDAIEGYSRPSNRQGEITLPGSFRIGG